MGSCASVPNSRGANHVASFSAVDDAGHTVGGDRLAVEELIDSSSLVQAVSHHLSSATAINTIASTTASSTPNSLSDRIVRAATSAAQREDVITRESFYALQSPNTSPTLAAISKLPRVPSTFDCKIPPGALTQRSLVRSAAERLEDTILLLELSVTARFQPFSRYAFGRVVRSFGHEQAIHSFKEQTHRDERAKERQAASMLNQQRVSTTPSGGAAMMMSATHLRATANAQPAFALNTQIAIELIDDCHLECKPANDLAATRVSPIGHSGLYSAASPREKSSETLMPTPRSKSANSGLAIAVHSNECEYQDADAHPQWGMIIPAGFRLWLKLNTMDPLDWCCNDYNDPKHFNLDRSTEHSNAAGATPPVCYCKFFNSKVHFVGTELFAVRSFTNHFPSSLLMLIFSFLYMPPVRAVSSASNAAV